MLIAKVVSELERERAMRVFVFPRLQQHGKLTPPEAKERMELLSVAIDVLNTLRDAGILDVTQLMLRLTPNPSLTVREGSYISPHRIKGGGQ